MGRNVQNELLGMCTASSVHDSANAAVADVVSAGKPGMSCQECPRSAISPAFECAIKHSCLHGSAAETKSCIMAYCMAPILAGLGDHPKCMCTVNCLQANAVGRDIASRNVQNELL